MQRKTLYYLIIALGILAAGWSVYCWNTTWRNIETNVPPTVSTPNATTPKDTGTNTPPLDPLDEKTGLRTYHNDEFGFEFQYPKEIPLSIDKSQYSLLSIEISAGMLNPYFLSVKVTPETNVEDVSLGDDFKKKDIKKQYYTIISDEKARITTFSSDNDTYVQIIHNKKLYSFLTWNTPGVDLTEIILSTFKFTK